MKRVGIDGHMIGDRSGGNESFYSNILRQMDFAGTDIEPVLFLKNGADASPFEDGFEIVRFESDSAFFRNFFELPRLCRKYRLDLLHTQYFIPFGRPCPVVCTIHDICFEHYSDIFSRKEYLRQKLLIPYAAKHSEKVFTVSEFSKKDIMSNYHLPEEKLTVVYNAVSDSFRHLNAEELNGKELRDRFETGEEDYLLCVGNLQPRKNLQRLIKSYRKFRAESDAKIKLVIVGKKAWLYDSILKEALQDKDIILTDYVSENDLVRLYNCAKAFIYPSYFEGFGIPPLEALACGVPVAVADNTSLPEVVGEAGVYFNPFDEDEISEAIGKVINDTDIREKILSKADENVSRFSWAASAQKIIDTYREILNIG